MYLRAIQSGRLGVPATDAPESPAISSVRPWAALTAWLACLLLLVAAAVITAGWHPDQGAYVTRAGRELMPSPQGTAQLRIRGNVIEVAKTDNRPLVLNLAIRPFRTAGSDYVMVDTSPLPVGTELALLWIRQSDPGHIQEQVLKLERDHVVPTLLDGNPEWRGEIASVAIGIKSPSDAPVLIGEVRLRPESPRAVLADMVRDWKYFGGWDGRSINVEFGGRDEQRVYLPPLVALAAFLVSCTMVLVVRRRGRRAAVAWIVIPVVASWMLLDLRWQRQLILQAVETRAAFAGKTLSERHAAMENPSFFELVETALSRLPAKPVRIFATSDFDYFRLRAGYYLYPHNVLAFDWADPGALRSGDYLLMFAKSDVTFDDSTAMLVWSDGRRLSARALIEGRGQGLYQIR
jgi:hypothetical protein